MKALSEMSLTELWQLFPILLTEHQECWQLWYEEEKNALLKLLPQASVTRISHIGSTAVADIRAKPIIDILVETSTSTYMDEIEARLCRNGWLCMNRSENRRSFNKGYTEQGFAEKVYHLHLRQSGDNRELYFRDYLRAHPDIARDYEQLKLGLWKKFEHDRDGYTEAKSEFVERYTEQAVQLYAGRYGSAVIDKNDNCPSTKNKFSPHDSV